jgi:hypothetical protein
MPSRKRPQSRRAGRPRARRTTANKRQAQRRRASKRRPIPLARLSQRSEAARNRALHVLAAVRDDPTLTPSQAARREGVKLGTVKKYFPSAVTKVNGKLRVTESDRYAATLYVPDAEGNPIPVKTTSWKQRQELGEFLRDLGRHQRGNRNALKKWRGKKIAGVELLTDERAIRNIEPALSDFSLYRAFNGGGV